MAILAIVDDVLNNVTDPLTGNLGVAATPVGGVLQVTMAGAAFGV